MDRDKSQEASAELLREENSMSELKSADDHGRDADHSKPEADGVDGAPVLDLAALRRRLEEEGGPEFWRSLDELAQSEGIDELIANEFPRHASVFTDGVSRRRFLQLASASLALGGLAACTRQPLERIVPYVNQPEEVIPGRPLYFATTMELGGYAEGLIAESHTGRPTKIEGNPDHPGSLGAASAFAQASILDLYDPDRSQAILYLNDVHTWGDFTQDLNNKLQAMSAIGGEGLRFLTQTISSPTLAAQLQAILAKFPKAKWYQWEPLNRDHARRAAKQGFGRFLETRFDLSKADVIVSLGSDFLTKGPGATRYARDFAERRKIRSGKKPNMNRLYSVDITPTPTGTLADHRVAVRPSELSAVAAAFATAVGVGRFGAAPLPPKLASWVKTAAADLQSHQGRCLVVAGDEAPVEVHLAAHAINQVLGNVGATVIHTESVEAQPMDQLEGLKELVGEMGAGQVDTLVILGGNPVFDAPADLRFAEAVHAVRNCIHCGLFRNETAEYAHWHLPVSHYLESWADSRAYDGTISIGQPLIEPLYGTKSFYQVLAAFLGDSEKDDYDLFQEAWKKRSTAADFNAFWRKSVHDGVVAATALPAIDVKFDVNALTSAMSKAESAPATTNNIELVFRGDPTIHDGRWVNNPWLQELPKPFSKLTWDNAAYMSPKLAERLGVSDEMVVAIKSPAGMLEVPVMIVPGMADGTVALHLGYGRKKTGRVGTGTGFDVYPLRTSTAMWQAPAATVRSTGRRYRLANTQNHHLMEGELESSEEKLRHVLLVTSLADFERDPKSVTEVVDTPPANDTLYPPYDYSKGYAWGLTIDLAACTGCNACVIACQSENNIPTVGKQQVINGREMHWIRIDRYYAGSLDQPRVHHQPVPCMQCEDAPCEVVCPVGATNHSSEGLNDMIYNRCVGTRYCSNNCPYKVRRFNFLKFNDTQTEVLKMHRNPDVTVRHRGVMEKCTYCVQRINEKKIDADRENRQVKDGEILTACQQTCPTGAIVFGNINDKTAEVTRWKAQPQNYQLLAGLNTRPRTSYLAKITNPNPELEKA